MQPYEKTSAILNASIPWQSGPNDRSKIRISFDRYHAFMALDASARDIAKIAVGRGSDWRGSTKSAMAEEFAIGNNTLRFDELLKKFGLK